MEGVTIATNLKQYNGLFVNKVYSETSQLRTFQIADMHWIADKMFSPKCENLC